MKGRFLFLFFFCGIISSAQQKITRTIKSDAPYVEVNTNGIDNLVIEESDTDELEMTILDTDGLGFIGSFSCNDFNCVLNIKTELKIEHPLTDKINQLSLKPPTNVSAIIKIPKNKKVTVFGETIDIQTNGYEGILRLLIDTGTIRIKNIKGITEVNIFAGAVFASLNDNALHIRTRKGIITLNKISQKSPYKKKKKEGHLLAIKSVNANVVLTEL